LTQPLPDTRPALLALHAEVRHRRDKAALDGPDYRQACEEIAAIEVQIARIEMPTKAAAPPATAAPSVPSASSEPAAPAAPAAPAPAQAAAPTAPGGGI
jgi:hypothetical protein